jgi:hypothetical protein
LTDSTLFSELDGEVELQSRSALKAERHFVSAAVTISSDTSTSRRDGVQFSETAIDWRPIPAWAQFLIKCGYIWADTTPRTRRIGVVSMPCESAAAGLLALGAIRLRLSVAGANDMNSHYQRIEQLAAKNEFGTFLRNDKYKGRFRLEGKDRAGVIWVRNETKAVRIGIFPLNACEWRLDGEAPVTTVGGAALPHTNIYEEFLSAPPTLRSNFMRSDSAICLAGRAAGESISKAQFSGIRFQSHGRSVDLSTLITVQSWSPGTVSRLTFFNTRTGVLDRKTGLTRLVITDGDSAFLKALEAKEFQSSDVLGVVHRVVERERLESVGIKIAGLAQWYIADSDRQDCMSPAPCGITFTALRRR